MKAALPHRICLRRRENRTLGPAANLQPHKCGNAEKQKYQEEAKKVGVHREHRSGENSGERKHREEQRVAVGARAIKAHDGNEQQEVHRGKQRGVKRIIGGSGGDDPRKKQSIQRKEKKISDDEKRRGTRSQFRRISVPPAVTFVK